MKSFLQDVLGGYGATLGDDDGVLTVALPEEGEGAELAKKLGRSELNLVFEASALRPGAELVAAGSHVLRVVEEFLESRGRRTYLLRPGNARLTLKALRAALKAPRGYVLSLENRKAAAGYEFYVVYRLHYRSIERVDVLETVRVKLGPTGETLADLEPAPDHVKEWKTKPRKQAPDDVLELALAAADARVRQRAREEGKEVRERVRKRFAKDVTRLHAYYAGQTAEYRRRRSSDLNQLRIEELDEERELRIKELVAATEVNVEIEPLQLLTVEVPVQTADAVLRASDDDEQAVDAQATTLPLRFDRSSGALHVAPCVACAGGFNGTVVGGCSSAHLVHEECLSTCDRCQEPRCDACDGEPCASCQANLCATCATTCSACEASSCEAHLATCGDCGLKACTSCLKTCSGCESKLCAEHLQSGPKGEFCRKCAVTCPGCTSPVAKANLARCDGCGRRFCVDCAPTEDAACVLCR